MLPRHYRLPWLVRHIKARQYTTDLPQSTDLLHRYRGLVALGKIQYDEEQVRVVMKLRRLQKDLVDYTPVSVSTHSYARTSSDTGTEAEWWETHASPDTRDVVHFKGTAEDLMHLDSPKGLLLIGSPGSGKSFLIDLWFSTVSTPYKARKHYNQLVLEIYRGVWVETKRRMAHPELDIAPEEGPRWTRKLKEEWQQLALQGGLPKFWSVLKGTSVRASLVTRAGAYPPMAYVVARRLILRHWLLVFDEIQLLDVSSATLLADVLSWYWRLGGVIVGTSNKVPEDLYKNGVQKDRLEPFVEALKARCPVAIMPEGNDWRLVRGEEGESSWYTSVESFDKALHVLVPSGRNPSSIGLNVFGHKLHIPWSCDGIAKMSFAQLCDESLGSADYLTLASTFHTLVITDIPVLRLSAKNQARRFISLVDALYEARCRLVCMAETEPNDLFFPDATLSSTPFDLDVMMAESVAETQDVYRPNVSAYDAPQMDEAPAERLLTLDSLSIFSGKDEQFAFKRALSRLVEMTSQSYAQNEQWIPLPTSERKWESASIDGLEVPFQKQSPQREKDGTDFAEEASYSRTRHESRPLKRPRPPQIREHHIWGVRDD